jgi:O-methyltransferase involved in polyketide biosynthesis
LQDAELFALPEARIVFGATNLALGLLRPGFLGHPSLRHSLLQRHAMIDHLLRRSGAEQVLELAAGLSRRGATFSADARLLYTEVDLPAVIAKKRALLERSAAGRALAERPNYRQVGGDVQALDLGSLLVPGRPAFVIAEGLCMYLGASAQRMLFSRVAQALRANAGGSFVFDLVPAAEQRPPGWTGRLLERLMKRATEGRGFERDARTRDDLASDVRAAGFDEVEIADAAELAEAWHLPHPRARTQMVLFVGRVKPT